jgi:hypothetical protein
MKFQLLSLLLLALLVSAQAAPPVASRILQLDDGMPLIVTPTDNISSADNETGQLITFTLVQDCKVDGIVLISAGTVVNGLVEKAVHSKMFGQQGVLEVSFWDTKAVDGSVLLVRATVDRKGNIAKDTKDMVASILPYGVGMLRNGKDAILPVGVPLTIFVDGTSKFKIVKGQKPKLISPPWPKPNPTPASPSPAPSAP